MCSILHTFEGRAAPDFFRMLVRSLVCFVFTTLVAFVFLVSMSGNRLQNCIVVKVAVNFAIYFFALSHV